jgi:hypothetical protein
MSFHLSSAAASKPSQLAYAKAARTSSTVHRVSWHIPVKLLSFLVDTSLYFLLIDILAIEEIIVVPVQQNCRAHNVK